MIHLITTLALTSTSLDIPLEVCQGHKDAYQSMACCGGDQTSQSVCTSRNVDVSSIATRTTCLVPNAEAELKRIVRDTIPSSSYPGFAISVQTPQDLVQISEGVRTRHMDPTPVDAIFRVQSMSKAYTGVLLAKMIDMGYMNLDASLCDFLPQFEGQKVIKPLKTSATGSLTDFDGNEFTGDATELVVVDGSLYEQQMNGPPRVRVSGNKTYYYVLEDSQRCPTIGELLSHRAGVGYDWFQSHAGNLPEKYAESTAIWVHMYKDGGVYDDQTEYLATHNFEYWRAYFNATSSFYDTHTELYTSTFDGATPAFYRQYWNMTIVEYVNRLAQLPLVHQPGEFQQYNEEANYLGAIMDAAVITKGIKAPTGEALKDVEDFGKHYILTPLGIDQDLFWFYEDNDPRLTRRMGLLKYSSSGPNGVKTAESTYRHYDYLGPRTLKSFTGGVSATNKAMTTLYTMLANGGQVNGVRVLSPIMARMSTMIVDPAWKSGMSDYWSDWPNRLYSIAGQLQNANVNIYPFKQIVSHGGAYKTQFWSFKNHKLTISIGTDYGDGTRPSAWPIEFTHAILGMLTCGDSENDPLDHVPKLQFVKHYLDVEDEEE